MTHFDSLCAREPQQRTESTRPHILPIYPTSAYDFASLEQGMAIFEGKEKGHIYGRFGNPTIDVVAQKIANMEAHHTGKEAEGYFFSSGMSAISTLMFSLLKSGDQILTQGNIYGGTTALMQKLLQPLGIVPQMVDLQNLTAVETALKNNKNIKLLYFETPSNPTLSCIDMETLAGLAKKYDIYSVVDNTFCTPYLQQPLQYGIDFVLHSTTKFLNGHGNSIAGVVVSPHIDLMKEKLRPIMRVAGTTGNPWDAWLLHNGLKTLALRMERHSSNAQTIAEFLYQHPKVEKVNYVGLDSHPDYALAQKQMRKGGGIVSFELEGGLEAGKDFIRSLQFCTLAPTLGDPDTLMMHPASMSHSSIDRELRLKNGITDGMIRISTGIEAATDIVEDIEQALENC